MKYSAARRRRRRQRSAISIRNIRGKKNTAVLVQHLKLMRFGIYLELYELVSHFVDNMSFCMKKV